MPWIVPHGEFVDDLASHVRKRQKLALGGSGLAHWTSELCNLQKQKIEQRFVLHNPLTKTDSEEHVRQQSGCDVRTRDNCPVHVHRQKLIPNYYSEERVVGHRHCRFSKFAP